MQDPLNLGGCNFDGSNLRSMLQIFYEGSPGLS